MLIRNGGTSFLFKRVSLQNKNRRLQRDSNSDRQTARPMHHLSWLYNSKQLNIPIVSGRPDSRIIFRTMLVNCSILGSTKSCFLKKNWPIPASFTVYFRLFNMSQLKLDKSIDGVLGIRTRGGRMEDADESTELRHKKFEKIK